MANCTYCREKAGLFKSEHTACAAEAEAARRQIADAVKMAVATGKQPAKIAPVIARLQFEGRLLEEEVRKLMLRSSDAAILEAVLSKPISDDELERLGSYYSAADSKWSERDIKERANFPGFLSALHANTLYQVLHGQVPYAQPGGFDDFNFQHDEFPILRRYATLAEYRSIPTGRSFQSVGLPIGGGLYYRVGMSQPRTSQTGLVPIDDGLMVITTKSIIYSGQHRNFRLPYPSILRFESFVDGFGIHGNHGPGKVFIPSKLGMMDEGWYFYNLVSALSKW